MQLQPYWTLNDVCKLALKVENQLKESRGGTNRFSPNLKGVYSKSCGFKSTTTPKNTPKKQIKKEEKQPINASTPSGQRCFKCHQGIGHIASEYPNIRVISLVEEKEVEEVQENSEDEKVVYADQGLSIVVQRNLKASCEESDEGWLRKNIFHTKCTSQDKVCLMIIDSGSFENVVSTEMVQKLGLKTVPHPNLYKLYWLQKGNKIKVKTRCLVSFFIGKSYKDEVL